MFLRRQTFIEIDQKQRKILKFLFILTFSACSDKMNLSNQGGLFL